MHVKVIKLKWEQQFDWNAANSASGIFNIFVCTEVRSWNGSFWDTIKLPMLHLWDSIFYAVIAFIPWTVTDWKQVQECNRIVCKCVLYVYFLFKVSNLFIFPGSLQAEFGMWPLGASHVTLSHKPFVFCRPSVLCSIDASSKVHRWSF